MFGNVSRVPHESLFKVRNYLAWFESWDAIEKTLENSGLLTFSYLAAHVNRYIKTRQGVYALISFRNLQQKHWITVKK